MRNEASESGGRAVPTLQATSRALAELPNLLDFADPAQPLFWNRDDRGAVGIGEALRLTFSGEHRFTDASRAWREIAAAAEIDDPVGLPGSGLIAFGTFAFADSSAAESVLIVPRIIVHRHRGTAWVTEVSELGGSAPTTGTPSLPAARGPVNPATWEGVELASAPDAPAATAPSATPAPAPAAAHAAAAPTGVNGPASVSTVATYLAGVREATRRIDAGALEKVVLSRQIAGELGPDADLRVPLARLSERYLDCWTFAVDGLIGASPETLVRSTRGAVSARVLAGTRGRHPEDERRDRAARDELLRSAKEQHEHDFAVQSVVTALAPFVQEMHTSEEPFALQLPNVWHLATDLGATLGDEATALEIVNALHPTAAVAGTPTLDAISLIAELEPFDRGRYSGAVGWIDAAGDGEWVIALRCAQVEAPAPEAPADPSVSTPASSPRRITATAGGGIVAGSDPQHELGETVSKFRPITEAFAR